MTGLGRVAVVWSDPSGAVAWAAVAACALALGPAGLRWLRVAQREHYVPWSVGRFAVRWWAGEHADAVLGALAVAAVVLAAFWPLAALAAAAVVAAAPRHLSVRGRTGPLAATRRLRTLALAWLALQALVIGVGVVAGAPAPAAAAGGLLAPLLVDAAAAVLAPVERRLGLPHVRAAAARLAEVSPVVVGITGSYGKTSTKNHLAHLVAGSRRVVASPASFNNRAGLAISINDHLEEGTEVFVAEMGTYGKGEIAELCRWFPPAIAVITAIGPVHLERFGSEERIVEAKSEITSPAGVVVVNADDARLALLADRLEASGAGKVVVRCSATDTGADLCVRRNGERLEVWAAGRPVDLDVPAPRGGQPSNLACAVAVALRLGLDERAVVQRLADLPDVPSRLASGLAPSGVYVIDDTFNANPAGARAALAALEAAPVGGRRVVVTPGMVELGARQGEENRRFARTAGGVATDLVVVGRTNRRALLEGAAPLRPVTVRTRDQAVRWVRANLGPGDAVLYENDLPDHYP